MFDVELGNGMDRVCPNNVTKYPTHHQHAPSHAIVESETKKSIYFQQIKKTEIDWFVLFH